MRRGKRKEGKVDYDIKLYDNKEYDLLFSFNLDKGILMSALSHTKAFKDGIISDLEDEWEVREEYFFRGLYPVIKKVLKRLAREIQEDVGKDFTFVTMKIEKIKFKKINDKTYNVNVKMIGDYFK